MFDISIISALFAGLLSFASPCVLPIVPFYLSYLAGVGMNQINSDAQIDRNHAAAGCPCGDIFCCWCDNYFYGAWSRGHDLRAGSTRVFRYPSLVCSGDNYSNGITFSWRN